MLLSTHKVAKTIKNSLRNSGEPLSTSTEPESLLVGNPELFFLKFASELSTCAGCSFPAECRSSVAQGLEQGISVARPHRSRFSGRFSHLLWHRTSCRGAHFGLGGAEHHGLGSSPSNPRLEWRFEKD